MLSKSFSPSLLHSIFNSDRMYEIPGLNILTGFFLNFYFKFFLNKIWVGTGAHFLPGVENTGGVTNAPLGNWHHWKMCFSCRFLPKHFDP
jgi:hypothetical protein